MTLQSDLNAAVAKVTADGSLLHRIVHGPADGGDSLVITEGGPVKTLARVVADAEALIANQAGDLTEAVVSAQAADQAARISAETADAQATLAALSAEAAAAQAVSNAAAQAVEAAVSVISDAANPRKVFFRQRILGLW
ncbi:conserved hypothetical protein [Magnetospirillum sp. LM-5]|uniref:hypothetical protein n=1 Tax=Magnetospirillum sp. LM-5 TaxID=2681466 RepID=UPI0013857A98|nr:hypothetical protein [Magnetospirillum sp. LM-5]CAA7618975.1 conserved hypothetical protein [Magnetospirillum sp. LM-5]